MVIDFKVRFRDMELSGVMASLGLSFRKRSFDLTSAELGCVMPRSVLGLPNGGKVLDSYILL